MPFLVHNDRNGIAHISIAELKGSPSIRIITDFYADGRPPGHRNFQKILISTIEKHGVVTENTCGKAEAVAKPGQIAYFVRPLSIWEKLRS